MENETISCSGLPLKIRYSQKENIWMLFGHAYFVRNHIRHVRILAAVHETEYYLYFSFGQPFDTVQSLKRLPYQN